MPAPPGSGESDGSGGSCVVAGKWCSPAPLLTHSTSLTWGKVPLGLRAGTLGSTELWCSFMILFLLLLANTAGKVPEVKIPEAH